MADRVTPRIATRKEPQQARSAGLVADILQAAAQVLAEQGARRFTTARVAERAGVSVGSLYQYFPNKASILFRLQAEEWRDTAALLGGILADQSVPPPERLRAATRAFVRSECAEAETRVALGDAAPLYRDAPEAREPKAAGARAVRLFLAQALPRVPEAARDLATDTIAAALAAVGKRISETPRPPAEVEARADALADMLCAYLASLGSDTGSGRVVRLAPSPRRRARSDSGPAHSQGQ